MDNVKDCNLIEAYLPYQLFKVEEQTNIVDFAKKIKATVYNCIYENSELKKGDFVIVKTTQFKVHVVRPGEDLISISKQYDKTVDDILALNKINKLFVGQQLFIWFLQIMFFH